MNNDCCEGLCVPWVADMECAGDAWEELPESLKCRSLSLAWEALRTMTAGRVGNCPVLMRPCFSDPCATCQTKWQPDVANGLLFQDNSDCGSGGCSCAPVPEIVLPGEVAEISQVTIGHYVVDPRIYRVDNGNRLVRMDGAFWPSCQVMSNDVGEPFTVGVWYVPGIRPNAAGVWAAGMLAYEFAKACDTSDDPIGGGLRSCRLPSSVTNIVRQGVSMTLGDTTSAMYGGTTGIIEVDAYVAAVNPNRLTVPPKVWSPDVEQAKHRFQHWQMQEPGSSYPKAGSWEQWEKDYQTFLRNEEQRRKKMMDSIHG